MQPLPPNIFILELNSTIHATPLIKQLTASAASLLGYSQEELINKPIDLIYDSNNVQWQINELLKKNTYQHFSAELISKSTNKIPALLSLSILSKPSATTTDFVLVLQDKAAECSNVESALSESEERFRQMADMAGEWLWEQDPEGYYSYSSSAVTQILGYSQDEVLGKHYTEFLAPQDKINQQRYASSHHPFYAFLSHYRHKEGHQILTESTGLPIFNANGTLLKWRGVDRDITAKIHFQNALIESEKRTRLIIESSLNAIVIMDSYGMINDWNHPAEKMFGWSKQEAIGQRLEELIIPLALRNAHRQGLEVFLRTGSGPLINQLIEQTAIRRDGTEFPVELNFSPLKQGNSYIFSGFIQDITERKTAEIQIRQAQIDLAIAQNEIKIAQRIQASLSPSAPIKSAHFEVTGFCLPADQVGGDYFDYFYRNENRLDMIIADVSGHSIGPALFMVETRSAIRIQIPNIRTASETLTLLNSFLFEDLDKADYFITLFYLQYDISKQRLSFANAGHPPPLLLSPFQTECRQLDADGLILGVNKHVVFEEKTITLAEGDLILLYTDGLTEAENADGEFFGLQRVSDILVQQAEQAPQAIINAILEQLRLFCLRDSFNDDITLLVFKRC